LCYGWGRRWYLEQPERMKTFVPDFGDWKRFASGPLPETAHKRRKQELQLRAPASTAPNLISLILLFAKTHYYRNLLLSVKIRTHDGDVIFGETAQ
jgi:hypothetical protein